MASSAKYRRTKGEAIHQGQESAAAYTDRMRYLRVIDRNGNKKDYESEFVPRIGERIELEYGVGRGPIELHHFRVKDVAYRLQEKPDIQVAILVEEENDGVPWPGIGS